MIILTDNNFHSTLLDFGKNLQRCKANELQNLLKLFLVHIAYYQILLNLSNG